MRPGRVVGVVLLVQARLPTSAARPVAVASGSLSVVTVEPANSNFIADLLKAQHETYTAPATDGRRAPAITTAAQPEHQLHWARTHGLGDGLQPLLQVTHCRTTVAVHCLRCRSRCRAQLYTPFPLAFP